MSFTVENSGDGASAATSITLGDNSIGASIVGGSAIQSPTASGLRRFSALFDATAQVLAADNPAADIAAADNTTTAGLLDCSAGTSTCTLRPIQPRTAVTVTLTIHIPARAASGILTIDIGDHLSVSTGELTFAAGLSALTMDAGRTLIAGTSATASLTGVLVDGVDDASAVTLPLDNGDLLITATPSTCEPAESRPGAVTCAAEATGTTADYGQFGIALKSSANGPQKLTATLSGGQQLPVTGPTGEPIDVRPIQPGDPVTLSGPFEGIQVGAGTLACRVPFLTRDQCGLIGQMSVVSPERSVSVPAAATVVSATLTWAATAPAKGGPSALDSVTLSVAGKPTRIGPDGVGTPVPDTKDALYVRSADVTESLSSGGTVLVEGINARTTWKPGQVTPMAGWTLDVIWYDPATPATTVEFSNPGTVSESTAKGAVTTIVRSGDPVSSLSVTLWATDPWASKAVLAAGRPVKTAPIEGIVTDAKGRGAYTTGFDLLTGIGAERGEDLSLLNATGRGDDRFVTLSRVDRLWIGPTLVVRRAAGDQPAG